MPPGLMIAPGQQSIQLIVPPLPRFFIPVVVKLKSELVSAAPRVAVGFALIVPRGGEAGMAGCFEAAVEGGQAGGDVRFREAEKGGLRGDVGRLEIVGDLIEGLPYSGIRPSHFFLGHVEIFVPPTCHSGFSYVEACSRAARLPRTGGRFGR